MLKVQHSVYHAPTLCALESFTPRCSDISLPRTEVVDYVTVAPGEYELFVAGTASVASTISTFTTVTWSKDLAVCNNYPLVLATAQTANNARFSIVRQTPFASRCLITRSRLTKRRVKPIKSSTTTRSGLQCLRLASAV
eukprot:c20762_g1_i8.p1 GENE.c20762_g1_i8~~c20762_g1_i8.p1  ORF type:complete len:139 (+),score=17.59 c20762_g1_i8:313-729(+)